MYGMRWPRMPYAKQSASRCDPILEQLMAKALSKEICALHGIGLSRSTHVMVYPPSLIIRSGSDEASATTPT